MDKDFYYDGDETIPSELKKGLAIACFVISIVSTFCCFGFLSPVSLILGIVAIAKKQGGKAFSIIGIVISSITLVYFGFVIAIAVKITPDIIYFSENSQSIIQEYEETGKAPAYFDKYRDAKYDEYWERMGAKDFDDFFGKMVEEYRRQQAGDYSNGNTQNGGNGQNSENSHDDDGETLVDLNYSGAMQGIKFLATM